MPYEYNAIVQRVVDGDTVVLDIDLGFKFWLRDQSFRLLGINAREKSEAGGKEAKANLEQLMRPGTEILLTSVKPDKYGGRYDAMIELPNGIDLAEHLVETGWAAAWTGRGERPLPLWPRKIHGTG